ncbi:PD-(D/E)XK nuclease superfamily protein [compost metagenome]
MELRLSWAAPRMGILATGKIDRLCETDDGRLLVIDYKVGRYHPQAEDDLSVQAAFYRSLIADTVARADPKPIEVVFHFLGSQSTLTFGFTREEFRWTWGEIDVTAERIRLATKGAALGRPLWVAFPLRRGQQCSSCPMRVHCERLRALPEGEAARFCPDIEGGSR